MQLMGGWGLGLCVPICASCKARFFKSVIWWELRGRVSRVVGNNKSDDMHSALTRLLQFSSVTQSCLTLYDPMYSSMSGFPVHHQLLEPAQTHVHWWWHPTISFSVIPFSYCLQSFPASGSFLMNWLHTSGCQRLLRS